MRNGLSHLAPHSFLFAAEAWILAWNVKLDARQVLIFAAHAKFSAWQVFYVGGRSLNSGAERQIRFSISRVLLRTRSFSLAYQVVFSGAASHFHFAPSFYSCGTSSVFWRHKSLSLRYKSCNFNRQVKITTLQVLILAQQVTFSGIQVTFTCRAYNKWVRKLKDCHYF